MKNRSTNAASVPDISKPQKRVWAAVWINQCLMCVWKFENITLLEASKLAMNDYKMERFMETCRLDPVLRSSNDPIAVVLRDKLGIVKDAPLEDPISILQFGDQEIPEWLQPFSIEDLIERGVITDPTTFLPEVMRPSVRVSTHYRQAATMAAFKT